MPKKYNQLPQVAFSILLSLSAKPRHGYEIMKQVADDSNGKIKLVPGALYTSLKLLHERQLVQAIDKTNGSSRQYYTITDKGREMLNAELTYYDNMLKLAKQRNAFEAIVRMNI